MNKPSKTQIHALHELQQYTDAETLTPALHDLCSRFGSVEKLVVLTAKHEGEKQAICFLRLASEDQEKALVKSLGAEKFGGEVVIVVDLKPSDESLKSHPDLRWRNIETSWQTAFHAA